MHAHRRLTITDIDLIELAITSKQYDVMNPIYEPVTTGTINYVGDHKWQVIITNEQAKPIKDSSFGVFRDNNNRLGLWGSSQLFEETSTNTWERDDAILDSGQTGRLEIMKLQPDYLDDPLVLERILYGFLLELPESTASETNKIAPLPDLSRALSAEERDKAYLLWCSRQLRDQMSQLLLEKRD